MTPARALVRAAPLAALLALGCGGGGDGGGGGDAERACRFTGTFSGAVAEAVDWNPPDGCGTSPFDDRIAFTWFRNDPHLNVSVEIPAGVVQGVATPGLAGHLGVRNDTDEWYGQDGDCLIDLSYEPGEFDDQYYISGSAFTFKSWVTKWQ